jgi:hypothetical protein
MVYMSFDSRGDRNIPSLDLLDLGMFVGWDMGPWKILNQTEDCSSEKWFLAKK